MIPHNKDIEAELAIRHLAASYTDAVNRKDPEDAAAVWAQDGVLVMFGQEVRGRDTLLKAYQRTFQARSVLFQMTHSGLVVVDGDRARCRWWLHEINQSVKSETPMIFFGLYQDDVVRTEEGWRFARRQLDEIRSGPFNFQAGDRRSTPTWMAL